MSITDFHIRTRVMNDTIRHYELLPNNGRKSFYGKAMVTEDADGKVLSSYGLYVIRKHTNGELTPLVDPKFITNTTATHIKSFCGITKKDYMKLWNELQKAKGGVL